MTYIELINEFWKQDRLDPIQALGAKYYFHLLDEANKRKWANPFELQTRITELSLLISRKSISDMRNMLRQRGLIDFISRTNKATIYLIKGAEITDQELFSCLPEETRNVTRKLHETLHESNAKGYNPVTPIEDIRLKIQEKEKPPKGGKKKNASVPSEILEEYLQQSQDENYIRFLNWSKENTPYIAGHLAPLSEQQFRRLKDTYGSTTVRECMENLENRKDLRKKYSDLYRTLQNWCRREIGDMT